MTSAFPAPAPPGDPVRRGAVPSSAPARGDGFASGDPQADAEKLVAYRRAVEATATFAIGAAFIEARGSLRAALALPWRLWRLHRRDRSRSIRPAAPPGSAIEGAATAAMALLTGASPAEAAAALDGGRLKPAQAAAALHAVAERIAEVDPEAGVALAREGARRDGGPAAQAGLAFALNRAGALAEPAATLLALRDVLRPYERARASVIAAEARLLREGFSLPPRAASSPGSAPRRALYISHLGFPHHATGYAVRTHAIMRTLAAAGIEAVCATRPGYPWDRRDARGLAAVREHETLDGVAYRRLRGPSATETPLPIFVEAAASAIFDEITQQQPTVVMAGSNHVNALPALIAARRAGLPFFYDIRGLLEMTVAAKRTGWERTERFALARRLETLVASEADRVFAISGPLREVLLDRGIDPARIDLAVNGVDVDRFAAPAGRKALRAELGASDDTVIFGFTGTLESYEGLETLAEAFARVAAGRADRMLVVVGDGPEARDLHDRLARLGVIDRARLPGRVRHDDIPRWCAACDVFVYPRRDLPLCALVPPLKPLEAMAAGKPVIVSALPALLELTGAAPGASPAVGGTGAVATAPDDVESLARTMAALAGDPALRVRLGAEGAAFASDRRTWRAALAPMIDALAAIE